MQHGTCLFSVGCNDTSKYQIVRCIEMHIVSWGGVSIQHNTLVSKNIMSLKIGPILHYFTAFMSHFSYNFKMLHCVIINETFWDMLHEYNFALSSLMIGLRNPRSTICAKVKFITWMVFTICPTKSDIFEMKSSTHMISSTQCRVCSTDLRVFAVYKICRL